MRSLHQRAARLADARLDRRARADRGTGRSRTAARAPRLIGAIVAGGGNTRFGGEPKGLRPVGGERIVDRVAAALGGVAREIVLVANAPEAAHWMPGIRVVHDVRAERGSLVGIHSALTAADGDDVLVVAWDMPFVTAPLLRAIASNLVAPIAGVVPYVGGRAEPFCAAYAASALAVADAAIARGDLRAGGFVDELPIVRRLGEVELARLGDPSRLFFNVNTAADLDAAEAMVARG